MVAELAPQIVPEREMRGSGCDDRCRVIKVIVAGVFGRSELLLHSTDAHEEYGRLMGQATASENGHTVLTGRLAVDLASLEVTIDGRSVSLSPTEMKLLTLVARFVGTVVPYAVIMASVWGPEWTGMAAQRVRQVTLNRLRSRLRPEGELLVTVTGMGLRLDQIPIGNLPRHEITRSRPMLKTWSRDWPSCRNCGRTSLPHNSRGYCTGCYQQQRRLEQRCS